MQTNSYLILIYKYKTSTFNLNEFSNKNQLFMKYKTLLLHFVKHHRKTIILNFYRNEENQSTVGNSRFNCRKSKG